MRLRDLIDLPDLALELLTGAEHLDREIGWVVTTDLPDPSRYLAGGELVLTGLMWRHVPGDAERFAAALDGAGVSGLAAGYADGSPVPDDLVAACRRHRLPLFRVPPALSFATVTEHLARRLSAQRVGDIGSVLDRHGRLSAASGADQALGLILDLISQDLGMDCWVITAGGRPVAGSRDAPSDRERAKLATAVSRAAQLPTTVAVGGRIRRSVFAVSGGDRLADWYLVFDGDHQAWEPRRRELAGKVAAVLAIERTRLDERTEPVRRLGEELIRLVAADGDPADISARLRLLGLDPAAPLQAVATSASAVLLRVLLEDHDSPLPIAVLDDHTMALVSADVAHPSKPLADRLRTRLANLAPGLGRDRVAIGVSDHRAGARGLRGALDEARHALTISRSRTDRVSVVGHDEVASHYLLLAAVPDEIRTAYRDRLLGPVRAYDTAHRSDLEATLETFLKCSGSWSQCAEQMHLHVNTVRYRIARITELTGRDLTDLEAQIDFFLALRLR